MRPILDSQPIHRLEVDSRESSQAAGSSHVVSSNSYQNPGSQYPDSLGAETMSIALIGPDDLRRRTAFNALSECPGCEVKEFSDYPGSLDELPKLLEQHFDVMIL